LTLHLSSRGTGTIKKCPWYQRAWRWILRNVFRCKVRGKKVYGVIEDYKLHSFSFISPEAVIDEHCRLKKDVD